MALTATAFLFSALVSGALNIGLIFKLPLFSAQFKRFALGYFLCLFAIYSEHLIEYTGYSGKFTFSIYAATAFHFLLAPFMNGVVKSLFGENHSKRSLYLEMIPALAVLAYMITFYSLPGQSKYEYLTNYNTSYFMAPRHAILSGLFLFQTVLYSLVWYKKIKEYSLEMKARASAADLEFIPWVSRWLLIITLFTFSIIVGGLTRVISPDDFYLIDQLENIVLSLIPHAFLMLMFFLPENPFPKLETAPAKAKSQIPNVEADDIIRLKKVMQEESLFLKADLTLTQVADRIGISRHSLSTLLSQGLKTNFYDFVNEQRIIYAKKLMNSDLLKTYSLSGIARESGFNNYVSFYRVFKRFTGLTPSEYLSKRP